MSKYSGEHTIVCLSRLKLDECQEQREEKKADGIIPVRFDKSRDVFYKFPRGKRRFYSVPRVKRITWLRVAALRSPQI